MIKNKGECLLALLNQFDFFNRAFGFFVATELWGEPNLIEQVLILHSRAGFLEVLNIKNVLDVTDQDVGPLLAVFLVQVFMVPIKRSYILNQVYSIHRRISRVLEITVECLENLLWGDSLRLGNISQPRGFLHLDA